MKLIKVCVLSMILCVAGAGLAAGQEAESDDPANTPTTSAADGAEVQPEAEESTRVLDEDGFPVPTKCSMKFSMSHWSAFYKSGKGEGVISCENGQTARVKLKSKGGGLTAGKGEIRKGTGKFSEVYDISDLYGSYVVAEASAGAGKSAGAQVVTKGEISLALSGTGTGVELGFSFGKFTIKPRD